MQPDEIVRAWKDESFRESLSAMDQHNLPSNPAGPLELNDAQLDAAVGGTTEHILTLGCCPGLTSDPHLCSFCCGPTTPETFTYACKIME